MVILVAAVISMSAENIAAQFKLDFDQPQSKTMAPVCHGDDKKTEMRTNDYQHDAMTLWVSCDQIASYNKVVIWRC